MSILSLIIFIFILGLLVLIHEFGHFIVAKKNGILVEEFGIGFPPRVFGVKRGETLYSINLFPIGGFVKLYGEEYAGVDKKSDDKLRSRALVYKKPIQKAAVILAGVFMNLLLAVSIYYGLLATNGFRSEALPLFTDYHFRFGHQQGRIIIADVVKNSPAKKAGITMEDTVLRFRPVENTNWTIIDHKDKLINAIKDRAGKPVVIELENIRNGIRKTVTVSPYYNKELKRAIIGANLVDAIVLEYRTPQEKVLSGFLHSYNLLGYNIDVFKEIFGSSFRSGKIAPVAETVSGPIGIFGVIDQIVKSSGAKLVVNLLNVLALLSLSLALMNVLPFPALDGGQLLFIIYEAITGRQPNEKVQRFINLAGFTILILLALLISVNDVIRLIR